MLRQRTRRGMGIALGILFAASVSVAAVADATVGTRTGSLTMLEQQLSRLAASSDAVVGVALQHLESGRTLSLNAATPFPMGSTVKVAIAVHILALVDAGRLNLQQLVTLEKNDVYRETYGPIATFLSPGSALTIRDLLRLMLMNSDNDATDVLLRVGGGTAAVTAHTRALGLNNLRTDRPMTVGNANDWGRPDISESNPISPEEWLALAIAHRENNPPPARLDEKDMRDTSTPADMAALLAMIWKGRALNPASTQLLLDIMYGCLTGPQRLKGLLPPGTRAAHKTGSTDYATNDVGIIDLPGGAGHLVAVVFTKGGEQRGSRQEAVIAQIARTAYDYFALTPAESSR